MKVANLVSLNMNTHIQKNVQLFHLLPVRSPQKVYIKGLKPLSLDPKVENTSPQSPNSLQNYLHPKPVVQWQNQLGFILIETLASPSRRPKSSNKRRSRRTQKEGEKIGKQGKGKKKERRRKKLRLRCKGLIQKDLEASALIQGGLKTRREACNTKN